ncbi:MAG TPA: efflux RND transporter periplasmic adaptor subunit, partial [Pseudolabrys sp.]|nr:efflux RND transporter periplasmic adaptor subunit [Pseudolabrys sp.]
PGPAELSRGTAIEERINFPQAALDSIPAAPRSVPLLRRAQAWLWRIAAGFFVAALVPAAAAAQMGHRPPGAPPPAVVTVTVHKQELNHSSSFIGHVQAIQSVDVHAQVSGYLKRVAFKGGQDVKKGQLLYVIEPAQYQAAVAAADAQLTSAQATMTQNQQNLERQKKLYQRSTVSQQALEQAQAQYEVSQANVQAAQAQLRTAKINLGYTTISSPIDGRIGPTSVTAGNLVGPTTGTLTTIVLLDPIRVVFSVNERALVSFKEKHPQASQQQINARFIPKLQLPDGSMYGETGHVAFVNNQVDPTTGTLPVYADFPNPHRLLLPGMLVTAVISAENPAHGFLVPAGAVQQDSKGQYLLVVGPGNKVVRHDIKTGPEIEQNVSVTSGLQDGDQVIVQGQQKVHPGEVVSPVPEGASSAGLGTAPPDTATGAAAAAAPPVSGAAPKQKTDSP